jgi:hypothetical protein
LLKRKESRNFLPGKLIVAGVAAAITAICAILNYAGFVFGNWRIMGIYRELENQAGK